MTSLLMGKDKKSKNKGKEIKINTAGWKKGIYFVRVKYKDEILTEKIISRREVNI